MTKRARAVAAAFLTALPVGCHDGNGGRGNSGAQSLSGTPPSSTPPSPSGSLSPSPGARPHTPTGDLPWTGAGPNPCHALNPITMVGPATFKGAAATTKGEERESFALDLPIDANLCWLSYAAGPVDNGDQMRIDLDNKEIGSILSCSSNGGNCQPVGADSLHLLAPFRATAGHHTLKLTAKVRPDAPPQVRSFAQGPAVTGFSPQSAQPGQTLTITGEGFTAGAQVTVGGVSYPVQSVSADGTTIVVTVPNSSTSGRIVVSNALGPSTNGGFFVPTSPCVAPFDTPTYVRPADDTVAFDSLLEASGFGSAVGARWLGAGVGNICGTSEKEMVLLLLDPSAFSILRGPAPYLVNTGTLGADPTQIWRAVAVGNLSPWPLSMFEYDKVVALRIVNAAGTPDLVVGEADPTTCALSTIDASAQIAPAGTAWASVAIGDFRGTGTKEIALVANNGPHFALVSLEGSSLVTTYTDTLDSNTAFPWRRLAAGDVDGDGVDELIATRQATDGQSSTVFVYKWNGVAFNRIAESSVGNVATSGFSLNADWAGAAVGDFNGDGTASIALVQNVPPYFSLLSYTGAPSLTLRAQSNLDTVSGQAWGGLAAADWVTGADQGAQELIAVRSAQFPYRSDVFVYGDGFNRRSRDSALESVKAELYGTEDTPPPTSQQLMQTLAQSHANTYHWIFENPGDYDLFVDFLEATKNFCIDGRQLRVVATLSPVDPATWRAGVNACSQPDDSPITPWNDLDFFCTDPTNPTTCCSNPANATSPACQPPAICFDYVGWANLIGRLAQDYPQLVGMGIDDFSDFTGDTTKASEAISDNKLAAIESGLRNGAPWMSFVPTVYHDVTERPDYGRLLDSALFFFRNNLPNGGGACDLSTGCTLECSTQNGECISGTCAETTIDNAPPQFCDMHAFMPGRKIVLGAYFDGLNNGPHDTPAGFPSDRYDYDLSRLVLNNPWLGIDGVAVYELESPGSHAIDCTGGTRPATKFTTVVKLFGGGDVNTVSHLDLTAASCFSPQAAAGQPFAYVFDDSGGQNVIYRGTDDHIYELWRTPTRVGGTNLTANAGAPLASTDPTAYMFPGNDNQNVAYAGQDGHLHVLTWTFGPVTDHDVTQASGGPGPEGRPFGYAEFPLGENEVIFRGPQGHLFENDWSTWPNVGVTDLSVAASAPPSTTVPPAAAGDPVGYVFAALSAQNAIYRSNDGDLHELYGWPGPVGHTDLTLNAGMPPSTSTPPPAAGDPVAYVAPNYGVQNVFYRDIYGDIHEFYWSTGAVGASNLTALSGAPPAMGDPAAYFNPDDGTNHVIYASDDSHLHEMFWTNGAVGQGDITLGAQQFPPGQNLPADRPSAYYMAFDHTHHVIYRTKDGHLHELSWGK